MVTMLLLLRHSNEWIKQKIKDENDWRGYKTARDYRKKNKLYKKISKETSAGLNGNYDNKARCAGELYVWLGDVNTKVSNAMHH